MVDRLRPALIIAQREVSDQLRDWRIIFPIVGLTLFFPFLMNFTAQRILNFVSEYGANIIADRLVPFLLMIVGFFPISVSLVIALETFVGEKERGSIEPLLNTPLQDWQLYLGKLLSATVPPLIGSFLGMIVYLTGIYFRNIPLPEFELMLLIVLLTIIHAVVMVSGAVVVSTQATSVRAANLLASFIIIPAALLIQGESIVMFWGHTINILWWAVIGLTILAVLLVRVGLANFQREELLGKDIDVLNIRWIWHTYWEYFTDHAASPWLWYKNVLFKTLKTLRLPIMIAALLAIAGIFLGISQVNRFPFPLPVTEISELNQNIRNLLSQWPMFSPRPFIAIFWQNLRVMLLAFVLGGVSLGILGVLPLIASMGIVGYLLQTLGQTGLPVMYYTWLIIPHGIFEISAAILATAAVLHAGAILATPTQGRTIGETWIKSLATWTQVLIGLVIPLLAIAAAIEAWFTPRIALMIFS